MTMNPELTPPHLVTRIMHLPMTSDAAAFCMSARVTERIVVELEEPAAEHRGGLASFVVGAVESALAARGAAPAGWQIADCLESKLDDQLYRARWLGAGGLALRFGGLREIADADGQLGAEDSAVLRRLLAIAERENLQLFLPDSVAALRILDAPRQLSDWLPSASRDGRIAVI